MTTRIEREAQKIVADTDRPKRLYDSCCSWYGADHEGWSKVQMRAAMEEVAQLAMRRGIELAAEACREACRSNVENPAIDMFERQRRSGIRWAGEYAVSCIKALLTAQAPEEGL